MYSKNYFISAEDLYARKTTENFFFLLFMAYNILLCDEIKWSNIE